MDLLAGPCQAGLGLIRVWSLNGQLGGEMDNSHNKARYLILNNGLVCLHVNMCRKLDGASPQILRTMNWEWLSPNPRVQSKPRNQVH